MKMEVVSNEPLKKDRLSYYSAHFVRDGGKGRYNSCS